MHSRQSSSILRSLHVSTLGRLRESHRVVWIYGWGQHSQMGQRKKVKGGSSEILDVDIFVNCVYLSSKTPSFLTHDQLIFAEKGRRLSTVVDVSCDTTKLFHPIPVYIIHNQHNVLFAHSTCRR
ncbi:hypothetical protein DFS33DRAFT_15948 [Desarmillaria ectypa]|nr:hypothetical protein DFS33DRAFT_15948 [Desarmillaria ectypa]